jgi:transcription initiation factor TFIIF subunit beta
MKKLKLVLEKNEANGLDTPSEYDMRITNLEVTNTYVFTERDLPGFEGKNQQNGAKEGQPAIPQRLINQHLHNEKKDWKNQKFKPYTRKPISSNSPSLPFSSTFPD